MKEVLHIISVCRAKGVSLEVDAAGTNLKIKGGTGVLTAEETDTLKRLKPEVIAFLNKANRGGYAGIPLAAPAAGYPLSSAQKRLWILHQLDETNAAYNEPTVIEFEGTLNCSALESAFDRLIARHEILRTVFREDEGGSALQIVREPEPDSFQIPVFNCTSEHCDAASVNHLVRQFIARPFQLAEGPLLRAALYKTGAGSWVFCFVLHHIICDGWSLDILIQELLVLYKSIVSGTADGLEPLRIQYKDYAVWQQEQLKGNAYDQHKNYWLGQFAGRIPVPDIPADFQRPAVRTYAGGTIKTVLPQSIANPFIALCLKHDCTLFMGLLAALNSLLYRYSGQEDMVVGTPVAGREHPDVQQQAGFYVNTLALRSRLHGDWNFVQLLQECKQVAVGGFAHQDFPFDELVEALAVEPDMSRNALFDVMLMLQNTGFSFSKDAAYLDEVAISLYEDDYQAFSKFDLVFEFTEQEQGLELKLAYNTGIYSAATAGQMVAHLERLMQLMTEAPEKPIAELDFLSTGEKERLLVTFNDTAQHYPKGESVTALFGYQAAHTPDAVAVIYEDVRLTYRELDEAALRFGNFLREQHHVQPGQLVGICLERSQWLLVSMLGCMYAGVAYLPIEPDYPAERIAFMVADSGCTLVVDDTVIANFLAAPAANTKRPDVTPHAICAVIYTTGSTGVPKGIAITGQNLLNRLYWMWSVFPFAENEVCAAKTSVSFVDHLWEMFGPLLKGVPLVIFNKAAVMDTEVFIDELSRHGITRLVLVPSLLRQVLQYEKVCVEKLVKLREWTCSGEALDPVLVDRFYNIFDKGQRLLNIYGSTEVTADATYYDTSVPRKAALRISKIPYLFSEAITAELDAQFAGFQKPDTIIGNTQALQQHELLQGFRLAQKTPEVYGSFLKNMLSDGVVDVTLPKFIGHMTGPVPPVLIKLNELMIPLNQNLVKFETSGLGTLMERQSIGMLHHLVYKFDDRFYEQFLQNPAASLGVITSGGTLSNVTALSYELSRRLGPRGQFEGINKKGLAPALAEYGYTGIVVIGSERCHYSIGKALKALGLGADSFVRFSINKKNIRAGVDNLHQLIAAKQAAGLLVLAMIGVGGSTESGNVDPLREMAGVARQFNIHFHVDAAFGGGYLFSERLSHILEGIELSDSVTICGHKQLYLPLGLSVCLFRSETQARHSENNTRYQARKGSLDIGRYTIEGSRPFLSMVLHGALHIVGKPGYGEIIESNYDRTRIFRNLIMANSAFQLFEEPEMNILLYRFIPESLRGIRALRPFNQEETGLLNSLNIELQKRQFEKGVSFVSYTEISDIDNPEMTVVWFRTVFMNPFTTPVHLAELLAEQEEIAAAMLGVSVEKEQPVSSAYPVYVGRPIANTRIYILTPRQQLAPVMVAGEICVGGDAVTDGYVNRPELMNERFISNPFNPEERLYKTGDLGRWMPDGNIEYLGRLDDQVKIRGHRIETGEVETALKRHPAVSSAVVTAISDADGGTELAAYLVAGEKLDARSIRAWLEKILPLYMIPAYFVQLDEIPVTSNGKIDKQALPDAIASAMDTGVTYVAPRNPTEEKLAMLWHRLLGGTVPGVKNHFFQMGGQSLKAARLVSLIQREMNAKLALKDIFANPVLEDQALRILEARPGTVEVIAPVAISNTGYALSSAQRRLWMLGQMDSGNSAYNITGAVKFRGPLHREALDAAFNNLIERHEILRTFFVETEPGEVRQFVRAPSAVKFSVHYHNVYGQEAQTAAVDRLLEGYYNQSFTFETAPLFRAVVVELNDHEWVLGYAFHHIISDGWSLEIVNYELLQFYTAAVKRQQLQLPLLALQYKDYAAWQQSQLTGAVMNGHREYWLERFQGTIPVLELPLDRPRPVVQGFAGDAVNRMLPASLIQEVEASCAESGATLFMGLTAALNVFLYRYSGQDDIILGCSVAGREHPGLEDQVGLFVNTLALRTRLNGNSSFRDLLEKVKEGMLGAFEHQAYPFDELVSDLPVQHKRNRNPLFDVMIALQHKGLYGANWMEHLEDLEMTVYDSAAKQSSMFDLSFSFLETTDGMLLSIEYNTDLFNKKTIVHWAQQFEDLLAGIHRQPQLAVNDPALNGITTGDTAGRPAPAGTGTPGFAVEKNTTIEFTDDLML